MMDKFKRSWALFKCSVQVINMNRKLLLFPVIIILFMCVIALFFLAPLAFWPTGHAYGEVAHWQTVGHRWFTWGAEGKDTTVNPAGYVLIAAIYLVSTFCATFFNVAFYSQILNALKGRPVSVSDGLRMASSRLGAIVAWSLFAGAVGLIIRAIEERVGFIGRWIVGLIGLAWSVASIFVIPSIVVETEGVNPVRALKNSAMLLKKTWGESLIGYLGLQFGGLVVLIGSVLFLAVTVTLSLVLQNFWILGVSAALWFIGLVAFMYLSHVASQVYMGALYLYATEGTAPVPFDQEQMNLAWKVKSGTKAAP